MVLKLRLVGADEGKALLLEDEGVPDEAGLPEDVGEAKSLPNVRGTTEDKIKLVRSHQSLRNWGPKLTTSK